MNEVAGSGGGRTKLLNLRMVLVQKKGWVWETFESKSHEQKGTGLCRSESLP